MAFQPDKDRPSTWKPYREGLCENCNAACCTMPVEISVDDLVRLGLVHEDEVQQSQKKIFRRLFNEGVVSSYRDKTGFFMLTQKPNGDCYFLDPISRMCKVYERRPGVCRSFPVIGPRPGFCPGSKQAPGKSKAP